MPNVIAFRCVECQTEYPTPHFSGCLNCLKIDHYANLYAIYEPDLRPPAQIKADWQVVRRQSGHRGLWRFADRLPALPDYAQYSLGEGMTPLIPLNRLGKALGVPQLWLKDESRNPTWSWKDRLMAPAVSAGVAAGATAIAGSSTGNAGASLAAYAAKAGLPAYIFACPPLPATMQTLMQSYGAHLISVPRRKDRFAMVQLGMRERGWYPVTNIAEPPVGSNSYGLEGYKTLAFELALDLDFELPDLILVPTSNGDGLFGIWRGLVELHELGLTQQISQLVAVRPEEAQTVAFSLGKPLESKQVTLALQQTEGQTCYVPEADIIPMQLRLAQTEGLYLEAASVVGLAALALLDLPSSARVVVVASSTGLKDPLTTQQHLSPIPQIEPTLAALDAIIDH